MNHSNKNDRLLRIKSLDLDPALSPYVGLPNTPWAEVTWHMKMISCT